LRNDPALAGVYLIALSGYGQDDDRRRTQGAGVDRHLVKPVNAASLQSALAAANPRSAKVHAHDS
jgi:CheY-like chemotaxis protein